MFRGFFNRSTKPDKVDARISLLATLALVVFCERQYQRSENNELELTDKEDLSSDLEALEDSVAPIEYPRSLYFLMTGRKTQLEKRIDNKNERFMKLSARIRQQLAFFESPDK